MMILSNLVVVVEILVELLAVVIRQKLLPVGVEVVRA